MLVIHIYAGRYFVCFMIRKLNFSNTHKEIFSPNKRILLKLVQIHDIILKSVFCKEVVEC